MKSIGMDTLKTLATTNNRWRNIGIALIVAGALYYPAMKLFKYLSLRRKNTSEGEEHHIKAFAPAYRGKRKQRHKAEADGQTSEGLEGLA
jgi:hypothetical protein